jgi:putative DNA primase/helicase
MFDVEDTAGLLSGVELRTPRKDGAMVWFDRVERGIRLRDGSGVAVTCDQHPDALAEALRWQVCEAEVGQAIGRGRGVNRTAETPLDIGILADVVLPLTIDQVEEWAVPGLEVEMEAEGIWLESPTDMAKAWPAVWATAKAAKEWLSGAWAQTSIEKTPL